VERISSASVFLLRVGPPRPNQMQTQQALEADGLVGLYRVGKKDQLEVRSGQESYLRDTDFLPSPDTLRGMLGPLNANRSR
jgi:hypothetical protein